jgi:predicted nucleotidyltransferase
MRNLSDSEVVSIRETVRQLTEGREIHALIAYGSQVAGYASESSDYDLIMVLKPFKQRVRYYYLNRTVECSILVVDPRSFENDCRKSTLGEFVSGRLLNAYYPIHGASYISDYEVAFKKKVILEGIADACAEYGEFVSEIVFPLSYFLFEKLRKRAAIYPPVVYSYSKTYGDKLLLENLDQSLQGFRAAAEMLDAEGKVQFRKKDETVSISVKEIHSGLFSRIGVAASYTNKSLRQYAVHGYAGRVKPNVVGKEVLSKISRSKRVGKLPE